MIQAFEMQLTNNSMDIPSNFSEATNDQARSQHHSISRFGLIHLNAHCIIFVKTSPNFLAPLDPISLWYETILPCGVFESKVSAISLGNTTEDQRKTRFNEKL